MKLNPKQIEAVLALDGPARYDHFIKRVVDTEEIWGLYKEGDWAITAADDGQQLVPFWPARDYAELCAVADWKGYQSTLIDLAEFLDEWLEALECDGILPGVFYKPSGSGVVPTIDVLKRDLRNEMSRYL